MKLGKSSVTNTHTKDKVNSGYSAVSSTNPEELEQPRYSI